MSFVKNESSSVGTKTHFWFFSETVLFQNASPLRTGDMWNRLRIAIASASDFCKYETLFYEKSAKVRKGLPPNIGVMQF